MVEWEREARWRHGWVWVVDSDGYLLPVCDPGHIIVGLSLSSLSVRVIIISISQDGLR